MERERGREGGRQGGIKTDGIQVNLAAFAQNCHCFSDCEWCKQLGFM